MQILDYKCVMLVLAFNITHFTKYLANILISNDHHKVVFCSIESFSTLAITETEIFAHTGPFENHIAF